MSILSGSGIYIILSELCNETKLTQKFFSSLDNHILIWDLQDDIYMSLLK